jgi:hypothetical protein
MTRIYNTTFFVASVGVLGFHRGVQDYNYRNKKTPYLYSSSFLSGLLGAFFYINPFFCVITIPKELYRLEVNIRGMEDEKKGDEYNRIL